MKKIIITAISAIAVIASVIGCQIYDSQTNKVLASAMNKDGSNTFMLQDLTADFNKACIKFRDNSSDVESYDTIISMYMGFDKFRKAASGTANALIDGLDDATSDRNKFKHDGDYVLKIYKQKWMTSKRLYDTFHYGLLSLYVNKNGEFKANEKDSAAGQAKALAEYKEKQEKFAQEYNDFTEVKIQADMKSDASDDYTFANLYEDANKLRWDYNSKK